MPVDFWKGTDGNPSNDSDTGLNTEAAVKHIENGEPIEESYLKRSPENIRNRSDQLRKRLENLEVIERSDRKLLLYADSDAKAQVKVSGSDYYFILANSATASSSNRDLYVIPMITMASKALATDVKPSFIYTQSSETLTLTSLLTARDGGDNIMVRWYVGTSLAVTVDGSGTSPYDPLEGPVVITVELASGGSTLSEIATAINAHSVANTYVTATSSSSQNVTTDLTPRRLYEGDAGGAGGIDAERFKIPAAIIDSFFGSEKIKDGEVLAINFADAYARLNKTSGGDIAASDLTVISSDDPSSRNSVDTRNVSENMGIIPICKCINGGLQFINDKWIASGDWDYLNSSNSKASDDLSTLQSDLADTSGTPKGDYMVGSEARTGTGAGKTLTVGTVASQVKELLDYYSQHVDNSSPQDKHNYGSLDGTPVYTVGTDGIYTTLQAALTALQSSGGILVLLEDFTLSSGLTFNGTKDVSLLGGGHTITAPNSVSGSLLRIDGAKKLIVEDVNFSRTPGATSSSHMIDITGIDSNSHLYFKNCSFDIDSTNRSSNIFGGPFGNVSLVNCTFKGNRVGSYSVRAFLLSDASPVMYTAQFLVRDSYFYDLGKILETSNAGNSVLGKFVFSKNTVENCGLTTDILFEQDTTNHIMEDFSIDNNKFRSDNSSKFSRLFKLKGNGGHISNNSYFNTWTESSPSSVGYMIDVQGQTTSKLIVIVGNTIYTGGWGAIKANYAKVIGNAFQQICAVGSLTAIGAYINTSSLIANKFLRSSSGDVDRVDMIYVTGTTSLVSSNELIGLATDDRGINCLGAARVEGNYIDGSLNRGIVADAGYMTVANNILNLTGATYGIQVLDSNIVVKGNNVFISGVAGGICLYIYNNLSDLVIADNRFETGSSNSSKAVLLGYGLERVSLTGNNINCYNDIGIDISADSSAATKFLSIHGNAIKGKEAGINIAAETGSPLYMSIVGNNISAEQNAIKWNNPGSALTSKSAICGNICMSTDGTTFYPAIDIGSNIQWVAMSGNMAHAIASMVSGDKTINASTGTGIGVGDVQTSVDWSSNNFWQEIP